MKDGKNILEIAKNAKSFNPYSVIDLEKIVIYAKDMRLKLTMNILILTDIKLYSMILNNRPSSNNRPIRNNRPVSMY